MNIRLFSCLVLVAGGCQHASRKVHEESIGRRAIYRIGSAADEGGAKCGNSAAARIQVLMTNGQFAEAKALIAEASASGLITRQHAGRLLDDIARLSTRLGDVPARLQRVNGFPSQLKGYTLHQLKGMLERGDFSIATQAQLKLAKKLIENPERLMEKAL